MTSSQSIRSPLARLVLFMVCLSIAGSIIAGAHYYAVDLPQQNAITAPENSAGSSYFSECLDQCSRDRDFCYDGCTYYDNKDDLAWFSCRQQCDVVFYLAKIDCDLQFKN
jgi:hypothetical protein